MQSFDVLSPAIDFYLKKGTPNQKLKTYYYQGRIFQNRDDRDNAMKSFILALDIAPQSTDTLTIARTLVSQGVIFSQTYQTDSYINAYIEAAKLYSLLQRENEEFDCLTRAFTGCLILNNKSLADSILIECRNLASANNDLEKLLYPRILSYKIQYGSPGEISDALRIMEQVEDIDTDFYLDMIQGYTKIGKFDSAIGLLENIDVPDTPYLQSRYYIIGAEAYEAAGKYKAAIKSYNKFDSIQDPILRQMLYDDLQFSEEKHKMELVNIKESAKRKIDFLYGISIISFLVIIILYAYFRSRIAKKEREKLKSENDRLKAIQHNQQLIAENLTLRLEALQDEHNNLLELLNTQKELDAPIRKAIQERMEMLNLLMAGYISENDQYGKTYEKWVAKQIQDKNLFMDNTRLALSASHPKFIEYLELKGLSIPEINHVCLYAIGLRGKEVGMYIQRKDYYNFSSLLRKKLGIGEHDTNLGIYIRKLLKSL